MAQVWRSEGSLWKSLLSDSGHQAWGEALPWLSILLALHVPLSPVLLWLSQFCEGRGLLCLLPAPGSQEVA